MIDFTKKELEAIKRALITHDFRYPDLMNKTQSLIDNHCDHEKISFKGDVYGYECKKCGADINGSHITDDQHEASMYE